MYVKLNGEMVYLWPAVDQEGEILESYVTRTRDNDAALRFMKKTLKRHGSSRTINANGFAFYKAAMKALDNTGGRTLGRQRDRELPPVVRRRKRAMLNFRRMKSLQKCLSVHANVHDHFNLDAILLIQDLKKRRSAALPSGNRSWARRLRS
jgi:putative transposase